MQRRNLVLDSYNLQVSNIHHSTLNFQLSKWKKNEWKLFNIPLESPPNLKMNYSLLVEMPNPPQTIHNTCPISSSRLLLKNQCCSKTQNLQNASKCSQMMNERSVRLLEGAAMPL
jgi:hypothetical protein